jgi:Tfp pilus assembly PilM family ATPase
MGKKPLTVAAFEIGPSSLKFVELLTHEKHVLSAGVFPLEEGRWRDGEHLAAQIRSAIDTTARGKLTRIIASVPLGHAHLRVVEVPAGATDAKSAHDHVAWDMSRYLARALDLYALDIQPGANPGHWIAAAFRREEAIALRDTLEAATGLPLHALDVDAAAAVNAFAAAYPELLAERTVLVHANLHAAAIVRTQDGMFQGAVLRRDAGNSLVPAAYPGAKPAFEAQERAEGLMRCARGIAEAFETAEGEWGRPDRIFLCGDLSVDADFRELLQARLPGGFNLLNPFRNMPGPDPADFPNVYPAAPFAAAMGLALRLAEES